MIQGRDFSNESLLNVFFRVARSIKVRLIGFGVSRLGFLSPGSSSKLYFGSFPRFINSRSIKMHARSGFGINARIECHSPKNSDPLIVIGENSTFGDYAHLGATNGITIGKNVLCGSHVLIVDHSHGSPGEDLKNNSIIPPRSRPLVSKGSIIIEDNVWICDGVVVLSGAWIGEGAIIATGAVVNERVDPFTLKK